MTQFKEEVEVFSLKTKIPGFKFCNKTLSLCTLYTHTVYRLNRWVIIVHVKMKMKKKLSSFEWIPIRYLFRISLIIINGDLDEKKVFEKEEEKKVIFIRFVNRKSSKSSKILIF